MVTPKRRNISQRSEMIYDTHEFGLLLDTREIFLNSDLGYTYDEAMIDHRSANTFARNIQILNNISNEPILVHMLTNGGDWDYGMAIYDTIKASPSDITILAYAHARSMSSIMPQAAKWRVIMPHADFLIHYGYLGVEGNYTSVVEEVDWSKKSTEVMIDIYAERCQYGEFFQEKSMTYEQVREWLRDKMSYKQEVYFTAREAVHYGFMDAVLGDEEFENISCLKE